jgi:rhodanese-related sulfurtransferase
MKLKILLVAILLSLLPSMALHSQSPVEVNSTEVSAMLKRDKNIIVLDVRTAEEFSEGHVQGAINMDMHQPGILDNINKLEKNATYIVYCRTKNRSGIVVNNMLQNGFKNIYQMMDGIIGWNQSGLPVVKK